MSVTLEERVWAYLDGLLSEADVGQFERDLVDPELSLVFAEALMMRELLRDVGPHEVPAELIHVTEKAVLRDVARAFPERRRRRFQRARAAFGGLSWAVRGPRVALASGLETTRDALSEIGNARYTLGPLADRGQEQAVVPAAPRRRSWWRRTLRRGK